MQPVVSEGTSDFTAQLRGDEENLFFQKDSQRFLRNPIPLKYLLFLWISLSQLWVSITIKTLAII